jgi:hypothetical protein
VNNPEPMQSPEQNIVEHKVRRAVGLNALRKIGVIVAGEQQADTEKANILRWFSRYGWIIMLCVVLLAAYLTGMI